MAAVVTIKDVAREVGVHPSTVSRALDPARRDRLGEPVVRRVLEAAERLGYRPDVVAASLRSGRSRLIGIVVPDIANPVFSPIISGLERALAARGYALIVADQRPDLAGGNDLVQMLIARRVDGLVLANVALKDDAVERCLRAQIPVVLVNRAEGQTRVPSVVSDDLAGITLAVDHLIASGHRRIVHVAGPQSLSTGMLRRRGFVTAMRAAGLDPDEDDIEEAAAFTREAGLPAARALLARRPDATAVVAANDLLALGVYEALREQGRRCPEDVSVIGHNDMPLVDLVNPPLSTVRISHHEMGERTGELLLDLIAGTHQGALQIVTSPVLVARASTRPLEN
ncbi:LacI family transcriptional regulator [Rhodopseudomonas boonkerdii]|uniref:LacI family DNA-binding transcriptional regulator n=1 Tax=Rhodopseudomonas boonkerdii TaxID=475937 RepID=UPI001E3933A6|nr:LacI family DNA-binding transcriptional regulator [Rhodopseudomonas boonkerdii]UGV24555.1 LacI family transcriptional regulator [Rhodopseudomonas boonkerdii]